MQVASSFLDSALAFGGGILVLFIVIGVLFLIVSSSSKK